MSSDDDDYSLKVPTDEDCTQENSQILIDNIQTKGNDVKETQQDIVYKKYSDDDSNGNEQNDYDEDVVEGTPQQESFDGRDKRVKRNLPLKFCQDKLLQKYIYKKSSNRYEQTVLKIKIPLNIQYLLKDTIKLSICRLTLNFIVLILILIQEATGM